MSFTCPKTTSQSKYKWNLLLVIFDSLEGAGYFMQHTLLVREGSLERAFPKLADRGGVVRHRNCHIGGAALCGIDAVDRDPVDCMRAQATGRTVH